MKDNFKSPFVAVIDVKKVKYFKGIKLGIDFSNEIDIWAKMEFRSRHQVKQLRQYGSINGHDVLNNLHSVIYSIREKIDET
jgi:hypothetical protein